jgi:hypothetical protein
MGLKTFKERFDVEKMKGNKNESDMWMRLEKKEKDFIVEFIWNSSETILEEIGFSLKNYKETCMKQSKEVQINMWKNDFDIIVAPINILTSKRQDILNAMNRLKNETDDKSKKKLKRLKVKLKNDDSQFWKRSVTKIEDFTYYNRIYHPRTYKLSSKNIKSSLVPNSIHSYDAAIVALIITICSDLGIQILTIHDSIGCNILHAPLIKILFKIANIYFIKKAEKIPPFPFKEPIKFKKKILKQIIESKSFFR